MPRSRSSPVRAGSSELPTPSLQIDLIDWELVIGTWALTWCGLVRDRHPEIARVVREHVVVDTEIEASGVAGPERARVGADEEDLIAIADAADECGGGTIG